jgi:uncharacterized protein (DUF427 family)
MQDNAHPITIEAANARIRVTFNGEVVADSRNALALREADYPVVYYLPRTDVSMALLSRTEHKTVCPHKGAASYYTIQAGDRISTNAVWSYETPFAAVARIAGHLAFYPKRVDSLEVLPC